MAERVDILEMYEDKYKRYDSFNNTWHICEEFGAGLPETWQESEDYRTFLGDYTNEEREEIAQMGLGDEPPPILNTPLRAPTPPTNPEPYVETDLPSDHLQAVNTLRQTSLLELLQIGVFPIPQSHPEISEKDRQHFARWLGLDTDDKPEMRRQFEASDIARLSLQFVKILVAGKYLIHVIGRLILPVFLIERGVPFRTLVWKSMMPKPPPSMPVIYQLPSRGPNYVFSKRDFDSYIHLREILVRQPRIRAALLRGGMPWRLVISFTHADKILGGPVGGGPMREVHHPSGETLVDDDLTDLELDLLCGTYICDTGQGPVIAYKSWFPPAFFFEKKDCAENYGQWTDYREARYRGRLSDIGAQPEPVSRWRDQLRGSLDHVQAVNSDDCYNFEMIGGLRELVSPLVLTFKHVSTPGQQILTGIQLIREELDLRCQLPVSSPMTLFTFANDPLTHGDYTFPAEADIELTYTFIGGNAMQQEKVKTVVQEWVKCVNSSSLLSPTATLPFVSVSILARALDPTLGTKLCASGRNGWFTGDGWFLNGGRLKNGWFLNCWFFNNEWFLDGGCLPPSVSRRSHRSICPQSRLVPVTVDLHIIIRDLMRTRILCRFPTNRQIAALSLSLMERVLASFTMYSELKEATTDSEYDKVFARLQMEWTYIGGLLVALAAYVHSTSFPEGVANVTYISVDTAVFSISQGSLFNVNFYARRAIATSSIASGLGIACDAWFLLQYNWADLQTFIARARDVYGSYFFFSLSARVPGLCMFTSALSLMLFLELVAFDAWPEGVVMSLQFLVYGAHWCVGRVVEGGRTGIRAVRRVTGCSN
ncbi:uncharacterized protein LACBIDRAFT_323094 [Laccaria bicolor S238N-H82]|uniref:Predicted protein n=1 Tax=Laccaria bicolor (strain S238N-H82 / ATCC MYA-4686) TaxID=486041 RepID=B0CW38_LACBS|nr:uncharacterized protein LACBIDRAFT_323094 [Laccaria bicolor S238N-H82]EDR13445.1 predicted protein [Laccaria bicolor S238N-H82]|eukprot:XP_001875943.1 predicted protein [Laccaria bicolor S238N-H82]